MDIDSFPTSGMEVGGPEIRIVLLGKTGVGKSSSGNTILRRNAFKANPSSTIDNQMETGKFEGQALSVVDTPGLLNTRLPEKEVKLAVTQSICYVDPGPHVFLVVIHAGRFTEEEKQTVRIFQEMFGKEAQGYTMALFTYGDDLDADGVTIAEFINGNSDLFEFIQQCGGGYHVFNNREKDPSQVRELLKKINNKVSDNRGTYYTAEMFQEVNKEKTQNPSSDVFPVIEADAVEAGKEEIRMVLLGKTGVGKSSSGDTILGRKAFKLNLSGTTKCQKGTGKFGGQTLAVVDTPGLLHRRLTEEQVKSEIIRCISFAAPGPHVFLVVLQGGRFKEGDENIVKIIQEMFGEEAAHYTMVLFTCGDDLEADGDTIVEIMIKDKKLCEFIRQCNVRYHVFENRKQDPSQVRELLEKINKMVRDNGGGYYKSEMFTQAERAIREEMKRLQRENPGMAEDEARVEAQKKSIFSSYFQSSRTAVKEKASKCFTQ